MKFNLDLPEAADDGEKCRGGMSKVITVVLVRNALGISVNQAKALVEQNWPTLHYFDDKEIANPFRVGDLIKAWWESNLR